MYPSSRTLEPHLSFHHTHIGASSISPSRTLISHTSLITNTSLAEIQAQFRDRIKKFYKEYNPSKLQNIDRFVQKYGIESRKCEVRGLLEAKYFYFLVFLASERIRVDFVCAYTRMHVCTLRHTDGCWMIFLCVHTNARQ